MEKAQTRAVHHEDIKNVKFSRPITDRLERHLRSRHRNHERWKGQEGEIWKEVEDLGVVNHELPHLVSMPTDDE